MRLLKLKNRVVKNTTIRANERCCVSTFLKSAHPMNEHTDFFVGWGTLSLINAGLAQSKGRSGLAWFLASLLLGPLATLLIVILPKQPQVF